VVSEGDARDRGVRLLGAARRLNRDPRLVEGARRLRERTVGQHDLSERLASAQASTAQVAARRLLAPRGQTPGTLGEIGLAALQAWQRLSESQGRGRGELDVAVLFTDLAGFSSWALHAGDSVAIELLREVADAIEPPIVQRRGEVVKRLGDGLMGAFRDAPSAAEAAFEAHERAAAIELDGYRPRLRTGIHLGRPRRIGGDYLGVDVNIAARLAEAANPDEILVSDRTLAALDSSKLRSRRRQFNAKGAPAAMSAHALSRAR
jgi:adenylate cyclase